MKAIIRLEWIDAKSTFPMELANKNNLHSRIDMKNILRVAVAEIQFHYFDRFPANVCMIWKINTHMLSYSYCYSPHRINMCHMSIQNNTVTVYDAKYMLL